MALLPGSPFVDYSAPAGPADPFTFMKADGSKLMVAQTPAARDLASSIDAGRKRDERTAGVDPRSIMAGSGADGGMSIPPPPAPVASDATMAPPAPPQAPPSQSAASRTAGDVAGLFRGGAPPSVQAINKADVSKAIKGANVVYPDTAGPQQNGQPTNPAEIPDPRNLPSLGNASAPQQTPPIGPPKVWSAGYNPQKDDAGRFPVRDSMTVETAGGIRDPEARDVIGKAYANQIHAENAYANAQIATANAEQKAAEEAAAKAEAKRAAMQAQVDEARMVRVKTREDFDKKVAAIDQENERAMRKGVDPHPLFHGNVGNGIMSALGVLMSGIGAGFMGSTSNPAMDVVQRNIDRSIDAQRQEIEAGRISRNNRIAELRDKYGFDMDDATTAYQIAVNNRVANEAVGMAAAQRSQDAAMKAEQLRAALAQKNADLLDKLYAKTQGETVKTTETAKFKSPQAAGYVDRGLAQTEKDTKYLELEARQKEALRKIASNETLDPATRERAMKYGELRGKLAESRAAFDQMLQLAGAHRDASGKIVIPDGKDIPAVGLLDAHRPQRFQSIEGQRMETLVRQAATGYGHAESGAAVSPEELDTYSGQIIAPTEEATVAKWNDFAKKLDAKEVDLGKQFGADAVRAYNRETSGVVKEQRAERVRQLPVGSDEPTDGGQR